MEVGVTTVAAGIDLREVAFDFQYARREIGCMVIIRLHHKLPIHQHRIGRIGHRQIAVTRTITAISILGLHPVIPIDD